MVQSKDAVKPIRRATRTRFSADEKIRTDVKGLRGKNGISEMRRPEAIATPVYYEWFRSFLNAGKAVRPGL